MEKLFSYPSKMLAGIFLILLVVVGLVVMALLLPLSPPVLTYYYYIPDVTAQHGSFATDNVVTITSIGEIGTSKGGNLPGSFNMVETYTLLNDPVNFRVLYQCVETIYMNGEAEFVFQNEMYTTISELGGTFAPIPPSKIKYNNALITGAISRRTNYIGKKFDVSRFKDTNIYQMRIGL